ncbi:MAG: hypothetical protein QHJ73_12605 [Armatimonadota bacterium]|nr:hypothetical protein [Armatimonadota bacterium]
MTRLHIRAYLLAVLVLGGGGLAAAEPGFTQFVEPKEKAFTALVPQGWQSEGGIVRWSPEVAGAFNAAEAKVDFTLRSDAAGTRMMRWLPDIFFVDMSRSPAGPMFPPGSQCNGCVVMPRIGGVEYLVKLVQPRIAAKGSDLKVVTQARVPAAEKAYDDLRAMLKIPVPLDYKAHLVLVEYTEGGTRFRQLMFVVIEDYGKVGVDLWKSRSTVVFRAPAAEFDAALPTFTKVQQSVQIDTGWLVKEMKAAAERTGQVAGVFDDLRKLDADIVRNRTETNEAIQKQMQELLTQSR